MDARAIWNAIEKLAKAGKIAEAWEALPTQEQEQEYARIAEIGGYPGGYALARRAAYDALEDAA